MNANLKPVTVRLPEDAVKRIAELAERLPARSRSSVTREALEVGLEILDRLTAGKSAGEQIQVLAELLGRERQEKSDAD